MTVANPTGEPKCFPPVHIALRLGLWPQHCSCTTVLYHVRIATGLRCCGVLFLLLVITPHLGLAVVKGCCHHLLHRAGRYFYQYFLSRQYT